jgi:PKD repeat protein
VTLTASKVGSTDTETKIDYITVFAPTVVVPITEFATNFWYATVNNPISLVDDATSLWAAKITNN